MQLIQKTKIASVLLCSLFLTHCVVAVVAGAAAGMVYDRRSVSTMEADTRLFHIIHKDIVTNPHFRGAKVGVTSFNRVVLLVGQVPRSSLRQEAEAIARNTPNVQRVYDELTVSAPVPIAQATKDSLITGQIRSAMLTKKGLESGSIRIVTENGAVYLMGIVTPYQASLAVDVARRVNGVTKVVKIFQYIR